LRLEAINQIRVKMFYTDAAQNARRCARNALGRVHGPRVELSLLRPARCSVGCHMIVAKRLRFSRLAEKVRIYNRFAVRLFRTRGNRE